MEDVLVILALFVVGFALGYVVRDRQLPKRHRIFFVRLTAELIADKSRWLES